MNFITRANFFYFFLFFFCQQTLFANEASSLFYIDQKDQRFYERQLIPKNTSSSLCGPVSLINLILNEMKAEERNQNIQNDLINQTIQLANTFKELENIDVNNGLVEYELIKYIDHFAKENRLNIHSPFLNESHTIYGATFYGKELNESIIQSPKRQIWQIKLEEIRSNSHFPGKPHNPKNPFPNDDYRPEIPGMENSVRIFHYLTKIQNKNNKEFVLIDPENPKGELILELENKRDEQTKKMTYRLIPKSLGAFKNFSLRPPFKVELKSIIE